MLERFDHFPFSVEDQEQRLLPALKLSEAGIPCIIYGEDALAFAHFVPTLQFNFHIVVADSKKDVAAASIADSFDLKPYTGGREHSHESILADATRPLIYPHSAHLEVPPSGPLNESAIVLIHPQSFFNLDVDDYSRSTPLPPFPDNIRFPTLPAFLDSMFDTLIDPNWGHCSQRGGRALTLWISYIFDYKLRQNPLLLPNGDLAPEVAKLKSSLKLENQQPFELWVRNIFSYKTAFDIRRDVLRKMGRLDLANRPVPTHVPGNRAFIEERMKALDAEAAANAAKEKKGARDLSSPAPSQRRLYSTLTSPSSHRLLAAATRLIRK